MLIQVLLHDVLGADGAGLCARAAVFFVGGQIAGGALHAAVSAGHRSLGTEVRLQ